ncbi:ammonium transporter [Brevundimonas subvibrioides]|uniref:Ammonium transporter n=1 Tax=Brevundimonas subvibrioides (strain ATCC 15264 / DSM 4735 / LMG 14903 / NBRC 16000 / CB 81) TaxID=633149 RepID=D9QPC8_BRESC|nr:ammonium transporter [Brevundimonas subvibrioides]ADL02391.1 ammonium transporter [Brevundimonas subvibrioides ATCC 15264]
MSQFFNRLPGVLALLLLTAALFYAGGAFAQDAAAAPAPALLAHQAAVEVDAAASSWILTSTALVLLMTLPGLALFYGGMVRRKNVIATITQSVGVAAVVSLAWFGAGYTFAFGVGQPMFGFDGDTVQKYFGSTQALFLNGVTMESAYSAAPGLPEYLWIAFQMTFAIITPALVTGAFAERIKYSALLLFTFLWTLFVYSPICHWVWGGGFLGSAGVLDFAGGAVVHVNSGVAGLVCALFLGARKGYGKDIMNAHNPVLTMIGASLLLVGWIGFNAGSAWAADAIAGVALLNTLLAAMAASLTWKIVEVIEKRKPSLIGVLSGMVAGLVAITPAAGFVDPKGAVIIGLIAGPVCYASSVWLKKLLRYDDSLDAFGIHGAGGLLGALLTGVFATTAVNGLSEGANVATQAMGLAWTIAWSAIVTFIILVICKFTTGLRVTDAQEAEGLDTTLHGEALENV